MLCDAVAGMLDAYLDGELPEEKSALVQEHLKTCLRCSAQIAETARLHHALRGARRQFTPTAEFRQKITSQLARRRRRNRVLPWASIAVALAAIVVIAVLWAGPWRTSNTVAELADLHVNVLASANQVDVVSSDRHTVKPWFQGRIPFTFNLPEFAGSDFSLLGGRMVYFRQQPGAQLLVAMRQHKISVLIFQESTDRHLAFPRPMTVDRSTSFGVETWLSQGLRFVLVSDADPAAIDRLARMLKEANL